MEPTTLLFPLTGLVLGLVFGAVVQRSDFCAMGAVADIQLMGDGRRMRSWLLAIGTAIVGTQTLAAGGLLDLDHAIYATGRLTLAFVLGGGLLFGFGMTLTGGCISKNLVRAGAGSLRAAVVLLVVTGAALATSVGSLAVSAVSREDGARGVAGPDGLLGPGAALLVGAGLIAFCLKDRRFRASRPLLAAGFALGLLVPLGWLASASLGSRPLVSLDYVLALQALVGGQGGATLFGVALVVGTLLGSFAAAALAGRVRWESFADGRDIARNLIGASMMGAGGALAGGCTIGQGISGVSTLGLGSVVAFAGIVLGAMAGLRTLESGGVRGAFRAIAGG